MNMAIVDAETIAFILGRYEDVDRARNFEKINTVYYKLTGESIAVESLSVFLEKEIVRSGDAVLCPFSCYYDNSCQYIVRDSVIYVFGQDGEMVSEHTLGATEEWCGCYVSKDGEIIFSSNNFEENDTKLWHFDKKENTFCELVTLPKGWLKKIYCIEGNDLYYEDVQGIVRYNISDGNRKRVIDFSIMGISADETQFFWSKSGNPMLRTYGIYAGEEEDCLISLSTSSVEVADTLEIVNIALKDTTDFKYTDAARISYCVDTANRKYPVYAYSFRGMFYQEQNDLRNRVMAEMIAGEGPDILFVTLEDMEMLYKKDLLEDIRALVSQTTLDMIFPNVIELGSIEETLVGLAPTARGESLLVASNIWAGSSWTLEEYIALLESGKLGAQIRNREYLMPSMYGTQTLILNCLYNSFLIDWEKKESHFDDERFVRLLELCGNSSLEDVKDGSERQNYAAICESGQFLDAASSFSGEKEFLEAHYVGWPAENGKGNYLTADGVVVVSKNCKNKEAASAFLECLFSKEIQFGKENVGPAVVSFPRESIRYSKIDEVYIWNGNELLVFEDGTNSLDLYEDFIQICSPTPRRQITLEEIIKEELSIYYGGEKTASQIAKIIDNRVQLYLDEK